MFFWSSSAEEVTQFVNRCTGCLKTSVELCIGGMEAAIASIEIMLEKAQADLEVSLESAGELCTTIVQVIRQLCALTQQSRSCGMPRIQVYLHLRDFCTKGSSSSFIYIWNGDQL